MRVQIVPPATGGATRDTFGTVVCVTSPRPIALPAWTRTSCTRARSCSSASSSATVSYPVFPRLAAATTTTGMPLSTQVTGMPPISSRTLPVGKTIVTAAASWEALPAAGPAAEKSRTTGDAVPGTPSIAASPS